MSGRILTAALALALTTLVGCSAIDMGTATPGNADQAGELPESCSAENPYVAVSLPNLTNPYYVAMKQGFEEAGREQGFSLEVQVAGDDDVQQLAQVEAMLQRDPCVLALNSVKSEPGAGVVKAANDAGVPVFTVNLLIDEDALTSQGARIEQYLGADNFSGGEIMGQQVLVDLGADADLSIGFVTEPDERPVVIRDEGFTAAIGANPNAKVVASVDGNVKPDDSLKAATEMLQGNPEINVIWASTGPATYGALQALGSRTDVKVYGFCAADEPLTDVYPGCAAQEPEDYARRVVEQIRIRVDGGEVEPEVLRPLKQFGNGQTPGPGEVG